MNARDQRTVDWLSERRRSLGFTGAVPVLGSPQWDALTALNPVRFAAVINAAYSHWQESLPEVIAQQLADELAVHAQLQQRGWEQVAHDVRRRANSPTWAEIQRRWET